MKNFDSSIWRFGANFTPSNAINQLEMWQEETFSPELIDRELGFAEKIGMNCMRVYLHDLAYEADKEGFFKRVEQYLEISSSHGIATMFTIFDDCWNSNFSIGKQPEPIPNTHNSGWIQSPGNKAADDLSQRPRLENYVKNLLDRFRSDERIFLWDLYNEPGNGSIGDNTGGIIRGNRSLPLLKDVFKWAREINPDQPLTAGTLYYTIVSGKNQEDTPFFLPESHNLSIRVRESPFSFPIFLIPLDRARPLCYNEGRTSPQGDTP